MHKNNTEFSKLTVPQLRGFAFKYYGASISKGPKDKVIADVVALHKSRPELLPKANVVVDAQAISDVLPSPVAINAVAIAEPKRDGSPASNPTAIGMPSGSPMLEVAEPGFMPGFDLVEGRVYKGTLCCHSDVPEDQYDHKKGKCYPVHSEACAERLGVHFEQMQKSRSSRRQPSQRERDRQRSR